LFARLLKVALGLVLLLAVLLALLVTLFDWNWARPAITRYLSHTSRRSVQIDDLYVHFSPTLAPTIRLRGVRVQNAAWADPRPMARVGEVSFIFESLGTLFDDQSLVALLVLKDADVDLERQADGLRNWRLRDPEYRGPGKYLIKRVEATNSRLRVVHRGLDLDVTMNASAAAGELPNRIRFAGNYADSPFSGDLVTSPVFSLQLTQETFPLRGFADSQATHFEMDGRMADFLKIGAIDAQIRINGPSLAKLHPFLRGRPPASRPYRAQGHLSVDQSTFGFDRFHARLGETDLAGDISLSRAGRRVWHANLRSEQAQMADLTSLSFNPDPLNPNGQAVPTPPAGPDSGRVLPAKRLATERLQYDDADVKLEIRRLNSPAFPALQSLRASVALHGGVLKLAPFDLGIAGGHVAGELRLDGNQHPAMSSASLDLRDLQLGQLIAKLRSAGGTSAPLAGQVRLQGRGDSIAGMLGSVTGSAALNMAPGRISNLLDAMLGLNGGKVVWLKLTGDRDIALNCASTVVDFKNGIGKSREFILDTAQTRASGSASIDLRNEHFDLLLTPQAKQARLFALGSAIHAYGSFQHAEYAIDKGDAGAAPATSGACPMKTAQASTLSAAN
jgi:uncharacterized protein involved in outer membrane biogenesis